MSAIFLSPFAFFALVALPVLAAIYLFRSRFRTVDVSSLMFWEILKKPRLGGLHLRRIQAPLLLLLELLLVVVFVLAAAGPAVRSMKDTRNIIVILDDSFSMLASGKTTPRERAIEAIKDFLGNCGLFQARFILAGSRPRLIDPPVKSVESASAIFNNWRCLSPACDLNKAIALASELAGKSARILVITDHAPLNKQQGSVEWWAFGRALPNLAFVSATRTTAETKDNCMLAVANLSDQPATANLVIEKFGSSEGILNKAIDIQPNSVERIFFEIPSNTPTLRAHIQADNLQIDDQVILSPQAPRPVKVRLSFQDDLLGAAVMKAVKADNVAQLTRIEPDLLITDGAVDTLQSADAWAMHIISESNAVAFAGPFILDRTHPITEGLSLDGVIWAAAEKIEPTGTPVIAAGNIPLITDRTSVNDAHFIRMRLNPSISTLIRSPNWPILISNIIRWRQSLLPGLAQANFNLGEEITALPASLEQSLTLTNPSGDVSRIAVNSSRVSLDTPQPGLYTLSMAGQQYPFAVNALSKEESDLTAAKSGKWGKWQEADLFWWEYRSVDWLFLLIALVLLTIHSLITSRRLGE